MSIQIQATTIIQQKSAMQMTLSCKTDSRKILLALEATCVMRNRITKRLVVYCQV